MTDCASLSLILNHLSTQSTRVADEIERMGETIKPDTPLGDSVLHLMDIVLDMDTTIENVQKAVAFLGSKSMRARRLTEDEQTELLQARRDRRRWEEERQEMERKIADSELKVKNLQELNSMLMERARAGTPSSGFCSASHSPRSIEEKDEEASTPPTAEEAPAAAVKKESFSVPPPKPERKHSQPRTFNLERTPEFDSITFKDSLQLHKTPKKAPSCVDLNRKTTHTDPDGTIVLSDSPEAPNEGPLCSTFREERSVYHTPVTSKKMRRRSSSLGDVMKKIFTPKHKVKNPILEIIDDQ